MRWLKHAFAIDPPGPVEPTPAEQCVIDRLVYEIDRRGMTAPAILMLESSRPLNYITSQFLVFFGPVARAIFDAGSYNAFASFLAKRGSIETLCRAIEDYQPPSTTDERPVTDDSPNHDPSPAETPNHHV